MKKLLLILIPLLFISLLVGCTTQPEIPLDATGETVIEGDGYTLTIQGTVLKQVKYTVTGQAVRVTVPEGVTKIDAEAGRMLFCAVSLTIPSTLETYNYGRPIDLIGLDWDYPRLVEIYDLSQSFDFDLENATYSSALKVNLRVIHKSKKEKSSLTEKDGFMYYESKEETLLVGFTELTDTMTVPSEYNGKPCEIGAYAFAGADLDKVTVSEGITALSRDCFYNTSLTEIKLPTTLRTIGESAFLYCPNLESIDLPEGVTEIGSSAFAYCSKLTSIRLPEGLEILDNTIIQNSGVTSLYIPSTVTKIEMTTQSYTPFDRLKEFTVHPSNPYFSSNDGVLFDGSGEKLIYYPSANEDAEYTVPETVKEICTKAFYSSANLTKITVSEGVEIIGRNAFRFAKKLETVILPATLTVMDEYALHECSTLATISVHEDNPAYTVIDGVLFDKAVTKLIFYPQKKTDATYTVPETVTEICASAVIDNKYLRKVILPEGLLSIGSYAFHLYHSDESLIINFPDSLEYIGNGAFYKRDLVLTWNYTYDWIATTGDGETETLTENDVKFIYDIKFKYLQDSHEYTLKKVKNS